MKRTRQILALAGTLSLLAACQLIVSNDLPSYRCVGDNPSSCPDGLTCGPFGLCVVPDDATDAGKDARPNGGGDGGDAGFTIGTECVLDSDCKEGLICGTSAILTTTIVPQDSKPVCTTPCCTSEDCPTGNVCYATSSGSNYCVASTRAGARASTQNLAGGAACTSASDCRSGSCTGRCADNSNTACTTSDKCNGVDCIDLQCLDTCCRQNNCATGSVCRALAGTAHASWACGAPEVMPNGSASGEVKATCTENYQCKNANCAFDVYPTKHCTPSCCSSADCAALGTNYACGYGKQDTELLKWCFAPVSGAVALGAACTVDAQCVSHYCDPELAKCMNVCCTDRDCTAGDAGTRASCLPSPVGAPTLRCIAE